MFYTITGEFVNNKKKIIERFSNDEKVNLLFAITGQETRLALPVVESGGKLSLENVLTDNTNRNDLAFTVKSKNGVKYVIAEKVLSSSSVINVSEIPGFKDFYRVVLCFATKRYANSKVDSPLTIDLAYEDSDTITDADRTIITNESIPSIDELIQDELIINNLNSSYFNDKKSTIETLIETEIDALPDLSTNSKNNKKNGANTFLNLLASGGIDFNFVSDSGEEKKTLDDAEITLLDATAQSTEDSTAVAASGDDVDSQEQITDFAQRYTQMRLDMCTQPEVFCPPGYKCIPSDSWSTLLSNVDNLDSNLENMNILDGDGN